MQRVRGLNGHVKYKGNADCIRAFSRLVMKGEGSCRQAEEDLAEHVCRQGKFIPRQYVLGKP